MKHLIYLILPFLWACGPESSRFVAELEAELPSKEYLVALSSEYMCIKPIPNTTNAYCKGSDSVTGMDHGDEWLMWYGQTDHMKFTQTVTCHYDDKFIYCGDERIEK